MKKFNLLLHPELDGEIERAVEESPVVNSKAELVRRAIQAYLETNYPNIATEEGQIATT